MAIAQKATERYSQNDIDGLPELVSRMDNATTAKEWSFILSDYISFGNTKLSDSIAIFNMNSATNCPNIDTDFCQVPKSKCYAFQAENTYPNTLPYRQRQEYLWDSISPEMWAKAFLELVSRKRKPVDTIRFSEAGDFRTDEDIRKVNTIAKIVGNSGIDVYTYSASSYLNWELAEHFTVNASNDLEPYGDKRYIAVSENETAPEDSVQCPYEKSDGDIQCGDCRLCIEPDAPDVHINVH